VSLFLRLLFGLGLVLLVPLLAWLVYMHFAYAD
jgi:uncharacterized membrane protein YukC